MESVERGETERERESERMAEKIKKVKKYRERWDENQRQNPF